MRSWWNTSKVGLTALVETAPTTFTVPPVIVVEIVLGKFTLMKGLVINVETVLGILTVTKGLVMKVETVLGILTVREGFVIFVEIPAPQRVKHVFVKYVEMVLGILTFKELLTR
jgi:hypothetical protein